MDGVAWQAIQSMGSQRVKHYGVTSQRVLGVNELYEYGV